jgi:hypothetical protein
MTYPYSDDYIKYDFVAHRYILTEKDVTDNLGIDIFKRLKNKNVINSVLNQVSLQVYNYIHQFNEDNKAQDYIIAKTEDGRRIIKEAMEQQLIYFLTVGDLSRTTDKEKRAMWFDEQAKQVLLQDIAELGTTICYQGCLRIVPCGEW